MKQCRRKKFCFVIVGGILCCVLVASFIRWIHRDPVIGGYQDYNITKAEFAFYQEQMKNSVRNYYQSQYGRTIGSKDWDTPVDGMTPKEYLKEIARKECLRIKALFILANAKGVIDYVDYDDFIKHWHAENKKRKQAIEAGEVVYGLTEFSKEEYLSHVTSQIEAELVNGMMSDQEAEGYVTEEEVKQYLQEHSEEWVENITSYDVLEVTVSAQEKTATDTLEKVKRGLEMDLTWQYQSIDDVKKTIQQLNESVTMTERIFDSDSMQQDIRECYELRMAAERLEEGKVSDVITTSEGQSLIVLLQKNVDEESAYQEYAERVRKKIATDRLEEELKSYEMDFVFYS